MHHSNHHPVPTTGMDQASQMATNAPYPSNPSWVDMSNAYPSSALSEYGAYPYVQHAHGLPLPSESLGRSMPPPVLPPLSSHQQSPLTPHQHDHHSAHHASHHSHHGHHSESHHGLPHTSPLLPPPTLEAHQSQHPSLPNLIIPSTNTWPSMLTGGSYSAPPMVMPPKPVKSQRTMSASSSGPRKMLTDDDRRRMCLYHEEFPWKKQTEIGEMFGVERSTVSKVLRKKEKYLTPEEMNRNGATPQRPRPKIPDIERTLTAWVRKMQSQGMEPTDDELYSQARIFSHGIRSGPGDKDSSKVTSLWLEKFKQKNNIGQASRLARRTSEANLSCENQRMSIQHLADPAMTMSPASPTGGPSPASGHRPEDPRDSHHTMPQHSQYSTSAYYDPIASSQGTTSMGNSFNADGSAQQSFSGSAITPDGNFTFSPDSNVGAFMPGDSRFQRPRSQTFPMLELEYANGQSGVASHGTGPSGEPLTPKYPPGTTIGIHPSSSPRQHEMPVYPIDPATTHMPEPHIRRINSNGSLHARQSQGSPVPPGSPSLEEARRGLDAALTFVNKCNYNNDEFMMVLRFFEGVGLRGQSMVQHQQQQTMGGLSRIPEGGEDMTGVVHSSVSGEPLKAE